MKTLQQKIFQLIPKAVALINENNKIIFSNDMFNATVKDSITVEPFSFLGIKDDILSEKFQECKSTEKCIQFQHIIQNNPQSNIQGYEILIDYVNDDDVKYLLVVTDVSLELKNLQNFASHISELKYHKQAKLKLEEANRRLRQVSDLKDDFVRMVTHELRTPLTVIKSYTSILQKEEKDDIAITNTELVAKIMLKTDNLISLVNDILDVEKLQSGKMTFTLCDVNYSELIEDVVDCFKPLYSEKQVALSFEVEEKNIMVHIDEEKVKRVFENLLSNSYKFTPEKGTVSIKMSIFEKDTKKAHVSITDSGIGIPEDKISRVFNKFEQIQNPLQKDYVGSGLGLPIVKEIVESLNGEIWIESKIGEGTIFHFTVPIT